MRLIPAYPVLLGSRLWGKAGKHLQEDATSGKSVGSLQAYGNSWSLWDSGYPIPIQDHSLPLVALRLFIRRRMRGYNKARQRVISVLLCVYIVRMASV